MRLWGQRLSRSGLPAWGPPGLQAALRLRARPAEGMARAAPSRLTLQPAPAARGCSQAGGRHWPVGPPGGRPDTGFRGHPDRPPEGHEVLTGA
jgi:hypothetical protein